METRTPNFILKYFTFALVFLFFVSVARAETIADYRAKIHRAKLSVDSVLYGDDDEADANKKNDASREILKKLRLVLPVSERVEAKGVSVETQNKWFAERLDAYESETDATKKRTILSEISERLGAIEAEITQLEAATNAARSKDEDKQKLGEILTREEFRKPEPAKENILQRIWRTVMSWLRNNFPHTGPFSVPDGGLSALSFFLQILIYALVLGSIAFVFYKFVPFFRRRFKFGKTESKSDRVVLGETLAASADSHTLFAEAEKLAREGQLRAAIRKGYIALLCDLSDRKIINLAKNKTNRDYLRDVRPRQEIFDDMKALTNNFERHWYGFGAPKESDWNEFRENYGRISKN